MYISYIYIYIFIDTVSCTIAFITITEPSKVWDLYQCPTTPTTPWMSRHCAGVSFREVKAVKSIMTPDAWDEPCYDWG